MFIALAFFCNWNAGGTKTPKTVFHKVHLNLLLKQTLLKINSDVCERTEFSWLVWVNPLLILSKCCCHKDPSLSKHNSGKEHHWALNRNSKSSKCFSLKLPKQLKKKKVSTYLPNICSLPCKIKVNYKINPNCQRHCYISYSIKAKQNTFIHILPHHQVLLDWATLWRSRYPGVVLKTELSEVH